MCPDMNFGKTILFYLLKYKSGQEDKGERFGKMESERSVIRLFVAIHVKDDGGSNSEKHWQKCKISTKSKWNVANMSYVAQSVSV